nr:unnamed protein product [Spirometra erinaceieuropaei]
MSGKQTAKSATTTAVSPCRTSPGNSLIASSLNRLNNRLKQGLLPESQCGFRPHRGTTDTIIAILVHIVDSGQRMICHHRGRTDMIFAARQLQAKCQEMRIHVYFTFVDLTKAFDTVNRDGRWMITQRFGCPERFIQMVRQLHDGMMERVTDSGTVSEARPSQPGSRPLHRRRIFAAADENWTSDEARLG